MRVFGLIRQFQQLSHYQEVKLTTQEQDRLRALALWEETGEVDLACQTFGLSRASLYRWRKRLNPKDLTSIQDRSRRPHRLRKPTWPLDLVEAVKRLRETYPRWGKDKLVVLLGREGFSASTSTVGRILTYLKQHHRLIESPRFTLSARKRRWTRPYAIRKPSDYVPRRPGDLVQIDTLDLRPVPGVILKQFTARDVVSRWDVLKVHSRATAQLASQFIQTLKQRMPFPIRAFQVDGGSEFFAEFEETCQQLGIRLFVLPPKSPKLNGAVERANRTHTEEFYEVTESSWTVEKLNQELLEWEKIYNTIRPHQALRYLTPLQFLQQQGIIPNINPSLSHMY
ncbi:MAG: integrase core domain-containing protein [Nitrospiria bacterium]